MMRHMEAAVRGRKRATAASLQRGRNTNVRQLALFKAVKYPLDFYSTPDILLHKNYYYSYLKCVVLIILTSFFSVLLTIKGVTN